MLDTGIGKGMLEIAFGLMSIALVGMLIKNSGDTVKTVAGVSQSFGDLLQIATFQSSTGVGRRGY